MKLTPQQKEYLKSKSPLLWIEDELIKNEQGYPISFSDHLFQLDILTDFTPEQVTMKPAQIGWSTIMTLKSSWAVKNKKIDAIYTLPTDNDVKEFVGGKVNRIIQNNPGMKEWTKDKDSIEQKRFGDNIIYYKGTWTQKAATMVTADLLIHDEVDSSKQDVLEQYESRLQHSKLKWKWLFSHPSIDGYGISKEFYNSDQKHWFIKCSRCNKEQFLQWPENVDLENKQFICKFCKQALREEDRRVGRWVQKYKSKANVSGYWITSLMCPWISAEQIVKYYDEKSEEFFYNKVLGLPYVGKDNVVNENDVLKNCKEGENDRKERIVIGCDTGLTQWYVMGNKDGIFYYNHAKNYDEIEQVMREYRNAILVMDSKGDLTKPRELQAKYPNRVFMCEYRQDRKTQQLINWGIGKESGTVVADRNRLLQLVIDEFKKEYITLNGKQEEFHNYVEHFKNIYRTEETDVLDIPRRVWKRKGDDHLVHATAYWRVGMSKYMNSGGVVSKPGSTFDNIKL